MEKSPALINNRLLRDLSTFGIGGPARCYMVVNSVIELQRALLHASSNNLRYIILGKGSNCLFDDRGFDGLVIHNKIDFLNNDPPNIFHVGAGYSFSRLGALTARRGWSGLEFASGIPGSVGGAVFMNAGANGGETCNSLTSVEFVYADGTLKTFSREELSFSYRTSPFQGLSGAIAAATFTLHPSQEAREQQIAIVRYRQGTQPYGEKSAGCVFRNPSASSAGALIDRCGLKGFHVGEAEVSDLHANFIVNKGQATAGDVLKLIEAVTLRVKNDTGITLETEVLHIPYDGPGQGGFHE